MIYKFDAEKLDQYNKDNIITTKINKWKGKLDKYNNKERQIYY